MKLLVVGASGFIGSHLMIAAKSRGIRAVGTRNNKESNELICFDITSQKIDRVLPKDFFESTMPRYAVICSAVCRLDTCYLYRDKTYEVNVKGAVNLMDDLNKIGIKPIFISTEFVFDGEMGYYDETYEPNPLNTYGRHKLEVERYLAASNFKSLILRLSKVVGDSPLDEHFFSDCYKKMIKGDEICCIEGQIFSPTYVKDVAEGILEAINNDLSGIYHLANHEYFERE
jgi:dTDP-4-dehydrorhamnose reductase